MEEIKNNSRRTFLTTSIKSAIVLGGAGSFVGSLTGTSKAASVKQPLVTNSLTTNVKDHSDTDNIKNMNRISSGADDKAFIDKLYPLNGGLAIASDKSVYSPGIDKDVPYALSCNAYLILRKGEWILWDTGIEDKIFLKSGGKMLAHNIRGIVSRTIEMQLFDLGLRPDDINKVILSHGHFDHVGNCNLFPKATFYIQAIEHQAMLGPDYKKYGYDKRLFSILKNGKVELLNGDTDLFADGSMQIFFTPGHTPGHSSLLVNLEKSSPVILSADVAHDWFNLENRLVPTLNSDIQQSKVSMQKLVDISKKYQAKIWLNHDIKQQAGIQHAPVWFS